MALNDLTENEETERLRDIIRWFEYKSAQGCVQLTVEQYDLEVLEGRWEPEID